MALMRRYPEAIALLDRGSQIGPLSPAIQQIYGMALSASGKPGEAIPVDVASIYLALGEQDQGLEWLNKGLDSHDPFIVRMTMNPALDGLRSDPRYKKLVAGFNIPE